MIHPLIVLLAVRAAVGAEFGADFLQVASRPVMADLTEAQLGGGLLEQTDGNATLAFSQGPGARLLFERQTQCAVGSHPCTTGGCCLNGWNCQPSGCCQGSQVQCGSSSCYDPTTHICCGASGRGCRLGYTCVTNGCCPIGQAECGATACYNPQTSICCGSQGYNCPRGYDCVGNGRCCPAGQLPCGADRCYNPRIQICCSDSSVVWGCPSGSSCCTAARDCYFPASQRCCAGGSCPSSDTCCTLECCRPGATCGGNGRCSRPVTPTPTPPSSPPVQSAPPSRTPPATPSVPRPPRITTTDCPTPTLASPQTKTETISFAYDPDRQLVAKAGPSAGATIAASNRAVIMNICDGINAYNGGRGGNSLELTHGGPCFQKRNRRIMCEEAGRRCRDALAEYISSFYPSGVPTWAEEAITAASDLTCDEFPFASSLEGGDRNRGVTRCVPSDDNNWQGGTMASFFNPRNAKFIRPGEKYQIVVVGWDCNRQQPLKRSVKWNDGGAAKGLLKGRDAFTTSEGLNRTGAEMFRGFDLDNPSTNLMPMPLGDLLAGTYLINLSTRGRFDFSIIDYNGQTFDLASSSANSLMFTLDDDNAAVAVMGTTTEEDVEVVYRATQLDAGVATITATAPTPTSPSAGTRPGLSIEILVATVLLAISVLLW